MKHWRNNKKTPALAYLIGGFLLILAAVTGILYGSTKLDVSALLTALFRGDFDHPAVRILLYVRLPRVWGAILCGGALAVAGAVIQGVLNNRLASPSIIGVNAGAGLAVTICSALGILGGWRMSLFAFVGAFAAVMLVSFGARRWGASRGTVILLGVALNSLLGAVSDAVKMVDPDVSIMTTHFKVGDFSGVTYVGLIPATTVILIAIILLMTLANHLDVLTLGDETAQGLGLSTGAVRGICLLLAALLAGAAVSVCGLLSFVGLLVPHGVRRTAGSLNRHLIPLCALFGGGFVALCDTLSRVIFAPYEIPVGIIMAFLGAPFFVFVLIKGKGGRDHA